MLYRILLERSFQIHACDILHFVPCLVGACCCTDTVEDQFPVRNPTFRLKVMYDLKNSFILVLGLALAKSDKTKSLDHFFLLKEL